MATRLAAIVVTASSVASAFLVPAGIESVDALTSPLANSGWQTVSLPCPECVIPHSEATNDGEASSVAGGANSLLVNITSLFDGNAVGMTDYPLYPPIATYSKAMVDIVPSSASLVDIQSSKSSRYNVVVDADSSFISEEISEPKGDSVIKVHYQILAVDHHKVSVDPIKVLVIKGADGQLTLLGAWALPSSGRESGIAGSLPSPFGHPSHKQCNMSPILCQWRDMIEDKFESVKSGLPKHFGKPQGPGCPGRKGKGEHLPTHIRPDFNKDFDHKDGHHTPGHFGKPHHRHHHHHSRAQRIFHGIVMILMPIVAGITMGLFVSLVGMIVGRLIAAIWIRLVRGGRRGYASVRLNEEEADAVEAEKGEVESPPEYEAAPVYTEKDSQ